MQQIAVTPAEAFKAIGIKTTKGYELIRAGDLSAFKIGRATRITVSSVEAYVAKQVANAEAA